MIRRRRRVGHGCAVVAAVAAIAAASAADTIDTSIWVAVAYVVVAGLFAIAAVWIGGRS